MCNRLKSGFGAFFRIWRIFLDFRRSRTRNRDLRVLTVGAHEHEHPQIPIFSHERLKSRFLATECSRWALMAKYQDFRVLMLMGAHREHPEIPIDFDRHFMLELSLSFTSVGLHATQKE